MQREVEEWKESRIEDAAAMLVIYRAFVEGDLKPRSTLHVEYMTSTSTPR